MKKVLLIYPSAMSEIPNSLAMISAIFRANNYNVRVEENTFKQPLDNDYFMRIAEEYKPDIVGISMLTMQVLKTYELIKKLKEKGFFVIVGGTHPTTQDKEAIEHGVDIVVRNEGEETLNEFLQGIPNKDILGITYLDQDKQIQRNPDRPRIKDLSTLPDPDFTGFNFDLFRLEGDGLIKGINRIYTSRGCPGRCLFCDSRVFGRRATYHSIDSIMTDIQNRVDKYGITKFVISDDCFTMSRKHVDAFCEGIKKISPKVTWQAWTRADMITPRMAKTMKDAGCYMVIFGIESGDPETLKRTCKGTTLEKNLAAPKIAHAAGLQVGVNLMFGFPWETTKSLDNTLKMIYELWNVTHMFNGSGSIVPFPGTELYKQYVGQCGFKDYWLNPRYQDCGVSLYNNAENPYAVSTLSQRFMYDDTYIQEEYFFKYSKEFRDRLSEVSYEIGRHNLETMYPGRKIKQKAIIAACKLSRFIYKYAPNFEKKIGSFLFNRKKRPAIEDLRNVARGQTNKLELK
jgi:anaerobic magnesium-protoporphyrin IX monomethyl ester cyclase